jgi:hypothetical protein
MLAALWDLVAWLRVWLIITGVKSLFTGTLTICWLMPN